jgi:competence protein ComEC
VRLDLWALLLALGIAGGTVYPPLGMALLAASLLAAVGIWMRPDLVPPAWRAMALSGPLFVGGGVAVAMLHATAPDPLREFAAVEPGEVVLVGRIASAPVPTGSGYRASVRVERLWYEEEQLLRGGGVEVYAFDLRAGVGDRVRVDGELTRPKPGDDGFDYGRYLSTKGVSGLVYASGVWPVDDRQGWVGQVHRRTDVALGYGLRPREAAVVRGMVLGDASRIPEELEDAFRRSGVSHVLAISGQHVAVLAAALYFLMRLFAVPTAFRNPATLGLVWLYIFVAGAPPSAVRAGVVATFVLAAPLFGRQLSPLHFMTTMLAAVLAWNPLLVYSPGFQLSVAAVFGILLLRKPLLALVEATVFRPFEEPPRLVSNLLAVSLAAQVATTPIVATSFGEVSVIGVLANLIAVPLSGPILSLGLVGTLAGNTLVPIAYVVNACNGFLVTLLVAVAQGASAVPFAAVATPGASLPLVGLFYLGCLPAAIAPFVIPEERWARAAVLLVAWMVAWISLTAVLGG